MAPPPYRRTPEGVILSIRLTPKSSRNSVGEVVEDANARPALSVHVASPPVEGAANTALIKVLSKTLRVPKSAISIVSGETSRNKRLSIAGDPDALEAKIRALL